MNKGLSVAQQNRLTKLARDIRKLHESTDSLAKLARDKCHEALAEALLLGQALNEVKQIVGHGNWLKWLEENCPKVPERTARRYMQLANRPLVADLENVKGLQQAYIAAGIIPEKPATKSNALTTPQSQPETVLDVSTTVESATASQPTEPDPIDPFRDSVRFMLLRLDKLSLELKSNVADVLEPLGRFWLEHRSIGKELGNNTPHFTSQDSTTQE